jgi:hypothetical protein
VGVVAACVVLVGLLGLQIPRLPEMWRAHRAAGCLSNLRQLTAATRMYLADNDDLFPYAGRDAPYANNVDVWAALTPYVSSADVFLCPQDPQPAYNVRWVTQHARGKIQPKEVKIPSSYWYLQAFYRPFDCSSGQNVPGPPQSMPLSAVVDPARKALFNCYAAEWAGGLAQSRPHHPAGWALGFADGHARLTPYSQMNRGVRGAGLDEGYNLDWTLCGIAGRDIR